MRTFPDNVGFRTGVVRSREVAYILAEDEALVEKDKAHTVVLTWNKGTWLKHILPWVAASACVLRTPKDRLLAIDGLGKCLIFGQGEITEGTIADLPTARGKAGPFRSVREIHGKAYAVGLGGLAMMRETGDAWIPIDDGLSPDADLESISGFSDTDIYAAGWKGQIWHYDAHSWHLVGSPTNVILTGIICAPDGFVYGVGQGGCIIRGRNKQWSELPQTTLRGDLWGVEWFQEKLWVSTMTSVYFLESDSLEPTEFGNDHPETAYHLSAADGQLWSIGRKDVMAFDGKKWSRIA